MCSASGGEVLRAAVLKYGVGNLLSIKFSLERVRFEVYVASSPTELGTPML